MHDPLVKAGTRRTSGAGHRRARRLLVVEDDNDIWLAISTFAFQFDPWLEIDFVQNAEIAREKLHSDVEYDAVLSDFLLADSENGYELHREWRGEPQRFAMMSSMPLSMPELAEGAFLAKPFDGRDLRRTLAALLGDR